MAEEVEVVEEAGEAIETKAEVAGKVLGQMPLAGTVAGPRWVGQTISRHVSAKSLMLLVLIQLGNKMLTNESGIATNTLRSARS